jgi:S1/P1 Nuclease
MTPALRHSIALAALLVSVTLAFPAHAWNALGHKVVAEIAWQELSPEQRQEIVDTLRRHPRFAEDFQQQMPAEVERADKAVQDHWVFQHAATWPDIARGLQGEARRKYDRPTWHYVNFPILLDDSDRRALSGRLSLNVSSKYPADTGQHNYNVMQAIKHCQAALSSKRADAPTKALAYCWLFHLVGDSHQPLHSTALFSVNQFPKGDRGGNEIPLTRGNNLHSLWDNLLGRQHYMSDVQREVAELKQNADWWNVDTKTDAADWIAESHELAKSFVYDRVILQAVRDTPPGAKVQPITLSDAYLKDAGEHARRRIVAAGVRLGSLLQSGR